MFKKTNPALLMAVGALVIVGAVGLVNNHSIKVAVTKPLSEAAAPGPEITYFGIAEADGKVPRPVETLSDGTLVFAHSVPSGFYIVAEAKPGTSGSLPGTKLIVTSGTPDLQVVSNQKLGDGSVAVCDKPYHGIPAVNPLSFENTTAITNVLKEFGCRFSIGGPITKNSLGGYAYVTLPKPAGLRQYYMLVSGALAFPNPSEVNLQVQVRDVAGNLGYPKTTKIQIGNPPSISIQQTCIFGICF